jgi:hypothetical protein
VAQTIRSWSDTVIEFTTVQGALSAGEVYLFADCQTTGTAIELRDGVNWTYAELQVQSGGTVNLRVLIQSSESFFAFNSPANSDDLNMLGYHNLEAFTGSTDPGTTPVSCFEIFSNMTIIEYGSATQVPSGPTLDPGSPMIRHQENDATPIQYLPLGAQCGFHQAGGTKWWGWRGPGPAS